MNISDFPDPLPDSCNVVGGANEWDDLSLRIEEAYVSEDGSRPLMLGISSGGWECETVYFTAEGARELALVLRVMASKLEKDENTRLDNARP